VGAVLQRGGNYFHTISNTLPFFIASLAVYPAGVCMVMPFRLLSMCCWDGFGLLAVGLLHKQNKQAKQAKVRSDKVTAWQKSSVWM
jgi:hypothetical protein